MNRCCLLPKILRHRPTHFSAGGMFELLWNAAVEPEPARNQVGTPRGWSAAVAAPAPAAARHAVRVRVTREELT